MLTNPAQNRVLREKLTSILGQLAEHHLMPAHQDRVEQIRIRNENSNPFQGLRVGHRVVGDHPQGNTYWYLEGGLLAEQHFTEKFAVVTHPSEIIAGDLRLVLAGLSELCRLSNREHLCADLDGLMSA